MSSKVKVALTTNSISPVSNTLLGLESINKTPYETAEVMVKVMSEPLPVSASVAFNFPESMSSVVPSLRVNPLFTLIDGGVLGALVAKLSTPP